MADRPDAARLVQAAETALADSDRYSAPDYQVEARAAVVAVLRELAAVTAGYPELITTDELIELADQIEQENHRGQ